MMCMSRATLGLLILIIYLPMFVACDRKEENNVSPKPAATDGVSLEPPFSPKEASNEVRRVAELAIKVSIPHNIHVDESVEAEAEELKLRFANALMFAVGNEYFEGRDEDIEVIQILYAGRGVVIDGPTEVDPEEGVPLEKVYLPKKYQDGAVWFTGFSGETQNQFEVRFPKHLARLVGDASRRSGFMSGTLGEEIEPDATKEKSALQPTSVFVPLANAGVVGTDDRVLKGQLNTRQASTNLSRIVDFVLAGSTDNVGSSCTGTLFGRHHVITAAHCIVQRQTATQNFGWRQWEHRVGRNGTDWHAEANSTTGWRWYWASSLYLAAAQATPSSSPREYDIAMVIFPDRHIGQAVGWFGLWYSQAEHDDMLNRGYPACGVNSGINVSPQNCRAGHMYGDSNNCSTSDFSSLKDSMGFSLVGYHSCDTSSSQSGSPLYRRQGNSWTIRGVHKGATLGDGSTRSQWQSFALITSDREDMAAVFKLAYP